MIKYKKGSVGGGHFQPQLDEMALATKLPDVR